MRGIRTTHIECDSHEPCRDGDRGDDEVSLPDSDAEYPGGIIKNERGGCARGLTCGGQ